MGSNSDPVTLHKYLYANVDPVGNVDPTGNFSLSSLGASINVIGTLVTRAQFAYDVFQVATGESDVSAKDFGLMLIMSRLPTKIATKFIRKGCAKNSFVGETLVATENGLLAIEEIKIGDYVWAYNEKTGEKSLQEVVHLIEGEGSKELVDIKLTSGEVITATAGHPFYTLKDKEWKIAGKLRFDDQLIDLEGKTFNIVDATSYSKESRVFNLTVSNNHTYYVGLNKVLAHNAPKCDIGGVLVQLGKLKKLDDKHLKRLGIDAHKAKKLITGTGKRNAQFDMLIDKKTNHIFLKSKDGALIDSTYSIEELIIEAAIKR